MVEVRSDRFPRQGRSCCRGGRPAFSVSARLLVLAHVTPVSITPDERADRVPGSERRGRRGGRPALAVFRLLVFQLSRTQGQAANYATWRPFLREASDMGYYIFGVHLQHDDFSFFNCNGVKKGVTRII